MLICENCNNPFPNSVEIDGKRKTFYQRKFCLECSPFGSHNTKSSFIKKKGKPCVICYEPVHSKNKKFCSQECHIIHKKNIRREKILLTGKLISHTKDKWYLIEIRGHKCEKCSTETWVKEPIPLDTHHKDGDNDNNYLDNLLLICPNCHRQTDNHGSKNKTNSKRKQYRKKRYDQGLSY